MDIEAARKLLEQSDSFKILQRIEPKKTYSDAEGDLRVLICDTETTGLRVEDGEKVIEVGALLISFNSETGQPVAVLDEYQSLEDPGFEMTEKVIKLHNITNEMVKGQHFDEEGLKAITDQADIVVCHNSAFDRPFLEERFPFFKDKKFGCSLADVDWRDNGYEGGSLTVIALGQNKFYEAHRAVMDCYALTDVLSEKLPEQKMFPLKLILDKSKEMVYLIGAYRSRFEDKEILKKEGFSWFAEDKTWAKPAFGVAEAKQIVEFLQNNVYETSEPVDVQLKTFSSEKRFSLDINKEAFRIHRTQGISQDLPKDSPAPTPAPAVNKPYPLGAGKSILSRISKPNPFN